MANRLLNYSNSFLIQLTLELSNILIGGLHYSDGEYF